MSSPKLRRVFALTALIAALSMVPAQAAGFAQQPHHASFSQRLEHWGAMAWSLLAGLWDKRSTAQNPDGASNLSQFEDGRGGH
jgi:hypothetical protein